MKNVSHANTDDPRNVFGEMFRRGPSTAADGGTTEPANEDVRMKDVEHTAETSVARVWSRGGDVEAEE